MEKAEFLEYADLLTERQAEAFWHRHVQRDGRQETAEEMGTSPSNVDNLERAAHEKIIRARNTLNLLDAVEYECDGEIGVCAKCDTPTDSLSIHPDDYNENIEDARMVCSDCNDELDTGADA